MQGFQLNHRFSVISNSAARRRQTSKDISVHLHLSAFYLISPPLKDYSLQIATLHLDDAILAVNKPAGLPTLPDGYDRDAPYLVGLLKQTYPALWTVHRLDKDTSGVIVFARTAEAHRILNTQFESRQTAKVYHALVHGAPEWDERIVALRLRPNGDRRHRTVVDARGGKEAVTDLRVLRRFANHALIEARPHTGRTHQIRTHLAAIGLPLVCDALYDPARKSLEGPGSLAHTALHAFSLEFNHPLTAERLRITAPYPPDFEQALAHLS